MNSFNPESFPPASNDPQLNLPLTSGAFFGNLVPLETKTISGGEYLALFHKALDAGFSGTDLQSFLREKGIEVKSAHPPSKDSSTTNYDTPDNGKYEPRARR